MCFKQTKKNINRSTVKKCDRRLMKIKFTNVHRSFYLVQNHMTTSYKNIDISLDWKTNKIINTF